MTRRTDFLIIGGGIAGLRAAVHLGTIGRVLLLTKAYPDDSNTGWAQGGIAAAVGADDTPDLHFQDTMAAGDGLCVADAVRVLVDEGPRLVNAIGNAILKKSPSTRVCYYTSEKFTNELINSIRYNRMDEFHKKFRSMDILLIDDIQFIAGKERTPEEFFHTFNTLYESHKQIVVTSDKFPKEIPGLEERLRSRFEWGLIADIQPPDVETKQAILKMKAEQNKIYLPEEVALFLANASCSNVRELEGYLVRLGAYASLTSTPINLETARKVLKDILVERSRELSIEDIIKKVSSHFNIKVTDLKSPKRLKAVVLPRKVAMYLARQLTSSSYPEIGERFGGKDHSTIIHAIRKVERMMEENYQLRQTVETLRQALTS